MDLKKLQHAATLAAERSYARAAARLHITQSALSQSIARIEAETGLVLFERGRSGARATRTGKLFLARAEALLRQAGNLRHEVALLRENKVGAIGFGFGVMPANVFLQPVLSMLAHAHPGQTIHVDIANPVSLIDALRAERIEFFIANGEFLEHHAEVDFVPIARIRIGYFVHVAHPLLGKHAPAAKDLLGYPLLTPNLNATAIGHIRRDFGLTSDAPDPRMITCDDYNTLRQLALDSDGILVSPVVAMGGIGQMVALNPRGLRYRKPLQMNLVTLAGRSLSPVASEIVALVKSLAAG